MTTTDPAQVRNLVTTLADDLAWLEEHSRQQANLGSQVGQLRLAAAAVRNVIGPFLEGQPSVPLHVAVVGGAGAGKSTVANMLSGAMAAESNPQAGFTRHPVAYTSSNGQIRWPAHRGFLGPLQRLMEPGPSNIDRDVYQIRRVTLDPKAISLLDHFVVWDCPDMTTWAATGYVPRMLEVSGLADVVIYVASDERYNDEVPTQFLELLLRSGKTVVVCLVKMRETDAQAFVDHFYKEVVGDLRERPFACLTVPQLTQAQLADPVHLAPQYRIPLVNQVQVLGSSPDTARRRTVQSAMQFLVKDQEQLMSVAKNDLAALHAWHAVVQEGQVDFEARYRKEYLTSEKFRQFDQALVRLLELLELPGVGKFLSGALWVVRTPYRLLKGFFDKATRRPEAGHLPERTVLEGGLAGWLDLLHKEAVRRADSHPLWTHVNQGFRSGLVEQTRERFAQGLRNYQLMLADEVERTARAIYEQLERNPAALNTLRGTKFALEIGAIAGTIITAGPGLIDIVLVPLAASVTHQIVELLGKQYVESQREQARTRQQALLAQQVADPLALWLAQWPVTGGSTYERLQLALRRIPTAIDQLSHEVNARFSEEPQATASPAAAQH